MIIKILISKTIWECKAKKNKEAIERSLLTLIKSFIDNDPTEKLLTFMAEKVKKTRNENDEIDKLMFSQPPPPF